MNQTKDEIFDIYIKDFKTQCDVQQMCNPNFRITEDFIKNCIEQSHNRFFQELPNFVLNEKEKNYLLNKIKSLYSVYQEEGSIILGDYEHDDKWYENLKNSKDFNPYYWERYKNYLTNKPNFTDNVINTLDKTLFTLMSHLGNPNEDATFSVRGLVVGDVQSGKTSNYIGLITKAADAGYRVIFILTGTIESLRRQTQQRVEEGFIGWDSLNGVEVGVGRGEKTPKAFTSRGKDFVSTDDQNTTYKLSNYSSEPLIFILKKNVSVLRKIYSSLKRINTYPGQETINYPALIIDDEADNASINTNKEDEDPTKINKHIRKILSLFTKSSYVGFTATPFANVFISYSEEDEMKKDDLFPKDFIFALNAPSNYCGPRKYFVESNNNIRFIKDYNDEIFPLKHRKEWDGAKLFDSFYESIRTFLIANAIRDLRDINKNTHRSMLINMSRFIKVQEVICDIAKDYYVQIKRSVKQTYKLPMKIALTNQNIKDLQDTFNVHFLKQLDIDNIDITWEKVFGQLYESIAKIEVIVVNSSRNSSKLNYNEAKKGLRVIAVGGLALSRGLTLEGLMTSYFYRNTSTFDVLMQMGRWFGYRDEYGDLCRIWVSEDSYNYYQYINESIEALKQDIKTMSEEKKKPIEFGIRVLNESVDLGITAANKMRSTKVKSVIKSFYGSLFETPYLTRNLDENESNIEKTFEFLNNINISLKDGNIKNHPYFRNIPFKFVKELIDSVIIPKEGNTYFDQEQIKGLLSKEEQNLPFFDVLVIGGDSSEKFKFEKLKIDIPLVGRIFDVRENCIRMSRHRLRLGGRSDTKYGIKEEEIPLTHTKAQDYLIKGRNPLLIIYFIHPKRPKGIDEELFVSDKNWLDEGKDIINLLNELKTRKYSYLVGYAIGFPQRDNDATKKSIIYTVNRTVDYYDKDHENQSEEE